MSYSIPVMRPKLPSLSSVSAYLASMDESRIYSNKGPLLAKFEKRLSEFFNVDEDKIVVCANATLALQGAAFLIPAQEFHVPAYTFPATLTAVINAGKKITLRDIREDNWIISTQDVSNDGNSALIEVLPFGAPFDSRNHCEWDYRIVDAAASTGSDWLNFSILKDNWVVIFSLHATKVLGIGEGGVAIFGSKAFADDFRAWINFGFAGSRESRLAGVNAKMSEISAAYGLATLDQWSNEKSEWRSVKDSAMEVSRNLGIESITHEYRGVSPYWIADFGSESVAKRAESALADKGIETRRWWGLGCHKMQAFKDRSIGDFPVTDKIACRTLGLPLFRDLEDKQFDSIYRVLSQALKG